MSRPLWDPEPTLAGEDLSVLVEAFGHLKMRESADGMFRASIRLPPALGDPLARALQRTEAELMVEDADLIGTAPYSTQPTEAQRRADALVLLVTRVGEAVRASRQWRQGRARA